MAELADAPVSKTGEGNLMRVRLPPSAPSYFAQTLSCLSFVEIGAYVVTVYILKSTKQSGKLYIGLARDLHKRLEEHNSIDNKGYSKRYAPWGLETYVVFKNRMPAEKFEKYLKIGPGQAFLKKRLV